jgi:inorganic pyrophosphatase
MAGTDDDEVLAFIEIPQGSRNKYEYDPKTGRIRLDRVLYSSVHYPADYGFVLDTLAPDGDPLDILVIVQEPTFPGCIVPARPVGGLDMTDEKGKDFKILAVPVGDPRFDHVVELTDLGEHWPKEIETFFATYKLLEQKWSEVEGWHGAADAWRMIRDCQNRWRESSKREGGR